MSQDRYDRRYRSKGKSAQFEAGYKGWATHQPEPNPHPVGSQEWADYNDGQWWAAYDYDEDQGK